MDSINSINRWTRPQEETFENVKKTHPSLEKGDFVLELSIKTNKYWTLCKPIGTSFELFRLAEENMVINQKNLEYLRDIKKDFPDCHIEKRPINTYCWTLYEPKVDSYQCYRLNGEENLDFEELKCIFSHPIIIKQNDDPIIKLFKNQIEAKTPASPVEDLLQVAAKYLGRRAELRKLVAEGKANSILLDLHMEVMLANQTGHPPCMLWGVQKQGKLVFVLQAASQLTTWENLSRDYYLSFAETIERDMPPIIKSIAKYSNLYAQHNRFSESLRRKGEEQCGKALQSKPPLQFSEIQTSLGLQITGGINESLQKLYFQQKRDIHSLVSEEAYLKEIETNLANPSLSPIDMVLELIDAMQWENMKALESMHAELPAAVRELQEINNKCMVDHISELNEGLVILPAMRCVGKNGILESLKRSGYNIISIPLSQDPATLDNYVKNYQT